MAEHTLASQFYDLGLFTFPVKLIRGPSGAMIKKPDVSAWRKVPVTADYVRCRNYGVRLDGRYVVVDVDIKNGKQGAATWLNMRAMLPDAARAVIDDYANRLQCVTMSGGKHHWFRLPDGMQIQKKVPGFPDIDFLSEGSYVVGPGTYFGTGTPYTIISGAIDDEYIPMYPREWQIATVKRETEYRAPDKEFTNTATALVQFRQYCESAPPAIEYTGGDNTTYKVAATARDLGIDKDHCFDIMWQAFNPRCQPAWDAGSLETIVTNAYAYAKGAAGFQDYSHLLIQEDGLADMNESVESEGYRWKMANKGGPTHNSEHNVICYLVAPNRGEFQNELWGIFRYNAFTDRPEYALAPPWYNPATALDARIMVPREITDSELGSLKHYLFQKYGYDAERDTIYRAVDFVARQATYHPIRSWLKTLQWDGVKRLDSWLAAYCGAEDTQYTRLIGPKVLLGAVSRILEPGCKMDYTLILEGEQGGGKSTVCEILGIKPEWFATMRPDMDKDARQVLSRKWMVEFAEIDALGKREATTVKAFMATAVDTYRPPYGRAPSDFPRQSIFIGTVNPGASYEYLNDPTGARRFWPVKCGDIDLPALRRDVAQLYAEAMQEYKNGALRYVGEEFQELLKTEVKKRQYVDPFVESIRDYQEGNPDTNTVSIQWLAMNVCHVRAEAYDARIRRRMIEALSYLGWKITGVLKTNARPPGGALQEEDFGRFLTGIGPHVMELRRAITKRTTFAYQYLARRWELGPLNTSMKQRLSRALREHGAETEWCIKDRVTKVTFEPMEVEEPI